MMWRYGYHGFGGIGMILGGLFCLAVLVGVILLIIWAIRRMSGHHNPVNMTHAEGPSAKEIAQMRYAKGEITREEYQQILAELSK